MTGVRGPGGETAAAPDPWQAAPNTPARTSKDARRIMRNLLLRGEPVSGAGVESLVPGGRTDGVGDTQVVEVPVRVGEAVAAEVTLWGAAGHRLIDARVVDHRAKRDRNRPRSHLSRGKH